MSYPLCIYSPFLGARSESFISRHIQDLLPSKTAVISNYIYGPEESGVGTFGGPTYCLGIPHVQKWYNRLKWNVEACLGFQPIDEQTASVKEFLKTNQVKVMMGQYLDQSLRWLELAHSMGIKVFGHAHGYDVSQQLCSDFWKSEYLKYNQFDGIITVSEYSRQRLAKLGIQAHKIHVVYSGIIVPKTQIDRPRPVGMIKCLAVGRMVAKKAPILLLEAFRRAAIQNSLIHLDYIGSGELLPAIRQFIQSFNLEHRVTLHGEKPNDTVLEFMKKADIFVQHSITDPDTGDEEGLPVAILEAMGHALPVISTRHAGIPEAVIEGVTGLLVDEGDCAGMTDCILNLSEDLELRTKLGTAGWERASEKFSWDKERNELLNILGLNYLDNSYKL